MKSKVFRLLLACVLSGCSGGGAHPIADALEGPWTYVRGSLDEHCETGTWTAKLDMDTGITFSGSSGNRVTWNADPCTFQFREDPNDPSTVRFDSGTCTWSGELKDGRTFTATATPSADWRFRLSNDGRTLTETGTGAIRYEVATKSMVCQISLDGTLTMGRAPEDLAVPVPVVPATCTDPAYPVYCDDDHQCWSPGTNCSLRRFTCGGQSLRCARGTDYASCCGGQFTTCASGYPYYCPADGYCHSSPSGCASTCAYRGESCD